LEQPCECCPRSSVELRDYDDEFPILLLDVLGIFAGRLEIEIGLDDDT
jgi:hypothetical protein